MTISVDEKRPYNIFLFPLIICLIFFSFIFVALINTGYYFEKKLLLLSAVILLAWATAFVRAELKERIFFRLSLTNVASAILAVWIGFTLVNLVWFGNYLCLEPLVQMFDGGACLDTMYHSVLAESLRMNGYPSILLNSGDPFSYHILSHCFVALLSSVLNIQCMIAYNYLFPIIFVPLFVFLLQLSVIKLREFNGVGSGFSFFDMLFTAIFIVLFRFKFIKNSSIYMQILYQSESCFFSSVLLLAALLTSLSLRGKTFKGLSVNCFLVFPLFMILLCEAKISTGFIYFICCCYYVFRKAPLERKTWGKLVFLAAVFILAYYIRDHLFSHVEVVPPESLGDVSSTVAATNAGSPFSLFLFAKKYITKGFVFYHYLFIFIPPILLACYRMHGKFLSKDYFCDQKNFFLELSFFVSLGGVLPGLLLNIEAGGSMFYFSLTAILVNFLILAACDFPAFFIRRLGELNLQAVEKKAVCLLVLVFILSKVVFVIVKEDSSRFKDIVYRTCIESNKYEIKAAKLSNPNRSASEKVSAIFSPSELLKNKEYQSFEELRKIILNDRKDYCIFIADDSLFYERQAYKYTLIDSVRPNYALADFFGVPVINSLFLVDGNLYRGDSFLAGKEGVGEEYSLTSVKKHHCYPKDFDYMEYARKLGKKHVAIVHKDSYEIKDCGI